MQILNNFRRVRQLVSKGKIVISVYGFGHVGAPTAAVWLRAGAKVIAVDKLDSVIIAALSGKLSISEPGVESVLKTALREKRFTATVDAVKASKQSDFKIIAVPVGLSDNSADLSALKDVASSIAKGLKKGDLVSLSTTVPPCITEEFLLPILEKKSNLVCEKDFGLIFTPERIYEGRAIKDIEENYPAIVAGVGRKSLAAGIALYSLICRKGVISMCNTKSAEAEKVFEGVYRDVNIALANELAKIADRLKIDFWEVRRAANSQPFCNLHKPGTGVGGACIPIYPHFLIEVADRMKVDSDITKLSREVNSFMPRYCVQQALSLLRKNGKSSADGKVTVLGLAFRGGVSDTRLSSSYDVVTELLNYGCTVTIHDPYVKKDQKLPDTVVLTNKLNEALSDADLIIVATDHPQYARINTKKLRLGVVVYDGRGILNVSKSPKHVFAGIGRTW